MSDTNELWPKARCITLICKKWLDVFREAVHAIQKLISTPSHFLVKHWSLATFFFLSSENGFLFYQGDMILDCELYETLHPGKSCKQGDGAMTRTKRNAVKERKLLWTSRVIPYYVPPHMCEWSISLYLFSLSINCFQTVRLLLNKKITSSYQQTLRNYLTCVITSNYKLDRDFQEPPISNRF